MSSSTSRDTRQAARQIAMYLEDGNRERLNVALAILVPADNDEAGPACCQHAPEIPSCRCRAHWHPHRRGAECQPRTRGAAIREAQK